MYEVDGTFYLDCINNVAHVGHCHPDIVKAGQQQMATQSTNLRYLHDAMMDYAEQLISTFPGDKMKKVFFVNSGTEANELALWLARVHTKKQGVVSVRGGYHGHSKLIVDISSYKHEACGGDGPGDFCNVVDCPDVYYGRYRDPDTAGELYAGLVKDAIKQLERSGQGVCAFIMESIMSCGGQIVPPSGYLKHVYRHIRDAGGLCIADEVQVGFGRVGKHFWSFEAHDVFPDIVTLGKPMGNGHPVSCVVTTEEVARSFANSKIRYFNTFGGNPVSCTIAKAVLDTVIKERLQENAQNVGSYLVDRLKSLQTECPIIGDVRGMGLMIGIELVKDRETRAAASDEAKAAVAWMKEHQVLLSVDGLRENVIKIKPPMCFTRKNADTVVDLLRTHFTEMSRKR
ncbi:alanine--glyoxylate aminotransferase 2-like isoform X2 [Corticium candelabrum]|nr:alanine--glyoxylate aminotransferase 2-like isoform X2 [Corticium candelabrum]XP_062514590.1 alanine--glyoxylate aminotransferase 2-like isoform X2 [Corticium candelabrum]XP_062514591.1 alanine--glyoxylate aminotransferase 2-like isoform X2 [Corticium candelabrum]